MKSFKGLMAVIMVFIMFGVAFATVVPDDMTFEGPVVIEGPVTTTGTLTTEGAVTFSGQVDITGETLTATETLTVADCGKTFYLNSATEFVTTLPAVSTVANGCKCRFIVNAAPSGANYTVVTGNSLENTIFGIAVVNGASVAGASEDTITFTGAAAVKGDWAEVISDGTSWYVSGQAVAATGITLTAAD